MRARLLPILVLTLAGGCARKLEGPTPTVGAASPSAVCPAQLDTTVELTGEGMSPLFTGSLTSSALLNLPRITLARTQDLAGAAASGSIELPDDPGDPGASGVVWTSQQQMAFRLSPSLEVPLGLYDVQVANPSGASGALSEGLLAVPPPAVTALSQDIACGDKANTLTLSGDFFIRIADAAPTVTLGQQSFTPGASADCRALPGSAGLKACTSLPVAIPAQALSAGRYPVAVRNPAPVGCVSAAGPTLTVFDQPVITAIAPAGLCSQAPLAQLVVTGTGFLTVAGQEPQVKVGSAIFTGAAGGCTQVSGTLQPVQQCTSLTLTFPAGTFSPGKYPVVVTNPAPVDCASSEVFELEINPPPTVTSVVPTALCSGGAPVTVTGTGLSPGAKVTLNGQESMSLTVAPDRQSAVVEFPAGLPTGGPYALTYSNPDGCEVTSSTSITVVPGPQIFFADPNIVYNGITVQGTVYGTGFTGAVQALAMSPSGGGASVALTFSYDLSRPNQVQIVVPKGTLPGDYDLQLNDTTGCPARLTAALKVVDQTTLSLASPPLDPAFGWASENTAVTVNGVSAAGGAFVAVPRLYLNPTTPGPTTVATGVGAVTFLDATHLTALIPTPKLPVGSYDLIVVNPDGKVGLAAAAFQVTALPPPTVLALSPGSVSNSNPQTFEIGGKDFRSPSVTLSCLDTLGAPLPASPTATVSAPSPTQVTVSFDASAAGAACVVRLTNGDNNTFADYSALVITNPSLNLYDNAVFGPDLITARRASVALSGNATSAARYLHVIGGDDGSAAAFATVESSSLSLLGVPSPFFTQRTRLNQGRAFAGGARLGRFLYLAGGLSGTTRLDTVERAAVLDPASRGEVTDLLLEVSRQQGLGKGVWYYRVASLMGAADPFNPGGENLASDPFPVQLPDLGSGKFEVTVSWKADPGASGYRVYRSPSAGATVGTEQVIAEVAAAVTSFKDTGLPAISTDQPLPVGSLGKWQTLAAKLSVPREGPGVSIAADPADPAKAYLYVVGGRQNATTALSSYEFLPLTQAANGSQTPAASFTAGIASLAAARWQLGAALATNELSSRIPAGASYLYALSGVAANGTSAVSTMEAALVGAGGQLTAFASTSTSSSQAGYVAISAGNIVFAFGGAGAAPDNKINGGAICGSGVPGCGAVNTPPKLGNFQPGQQMKSGRYLHGGALSGAYLYMVGGLSGSPATVISTTEYRLW